MIVVIQCAGSKQPGAGCLRRSDGTPVLFVAHPESAPPGGGHAYARPDDISGDGRSWREILVEYNANPRGNPLRLLPAYRLYRHEAYRRLVEAFGLDRVYILSAGWGLIPASFLTPDYDITFQPMAAPYQRRRHADSYRDFRMLADEPSDITFVGGKDYVPLFCSLTSAARGARTVYFNSERPPAAPGCVLERFPTSRKTNWHYECAESLAEGRGRLPSADRVQGGPHLAPTRAVEASGRERGMRRDDLVAAHVRKLIDGFDHYIQVYDQQFPFTKAEQAAAHVRTLQLRARAGSAKDAIADSGFLRSLYETLRAWRIGQRGSTLVPLNDFEARLRSRSDEIARLDGLAIDDPALRIDFVVHDAWRLIESLGVVTNKTPLVAGSKTLHHLLPDLVPPMDRVYTRPFFGWYQPQFQSQQQRVFEEAMRAIWGIAVTVQPRRLHGDGWRTSLAKLLDNAIVAFVIENRIERA